MRNYKLRIANYGFKKSSSLNAWFIYTSILAFILGVIMFDGCNKNSETTDKSVLLPVKEDPTISFRIWFKVGSQYDPKGKEGLAALTASMLTDGATQTNSYEQILDKLYPMAANYSSKVDKEMTIIFGRTHKDNLDGFYSLMIDAILKPAFKDEDFKRLKSDMLNYIEKTLRYASDEELGKATLYNFIFNGTNYAHITNGTVESLNSITLNDVKAFYAKYYTKENYVIGLGGGYDEHRIHIMEADLDKLPAGKPVETPKPQPEKINGLQVELVEKETDATAISFGFPIDILRNDDDFVALSLFDSWFGEHRNSSSHLYQVIREKRGLNYGDYSYLETFLNGGALEVPEPNNPHRQQIFEVWIRPVQNQNRHFALRAAMRELKKVVDNGLTQAQFDLTKKYLYNYCLFYAPTTMKRLGYQIDSKFYGVNDNGNYINYFREKINSLTLEQVNIAIKKHIQYNNIKIAIITKDAAAFKDELINDTPSPITYVSPVGDEVLKEDQEIITFPLKVKPENIKIVNVDDMFQK